MSKAADEFRALSREAEKGRLLLRDDAARRCAAECDKYIAQLRHLRDRAEGKPGGRPLVYWEAFGPFNCARTLGTKFRSLIDGPGEDSLVARIDERIQVVTEMARTFRESGAAYHREDHRTQRSAQGLL